MLFFFIIIYNVYYEFDIYTNSLYIVNLEMFMFNTR